MKELGPECKTKSSLVENNKIIFGGKQQIHLWWKTTKSSLVENNKIVFGGKQQNHLWWKTIKSSLVMNNKINLCIPRLINCIHLGDRSSFLHFKMLFKYYESACWIYMKCLTALQNWQLNLFAIRTGSELSRSTSVNSVTSQRSHFLIII